MRYFNTIKFLLAVLKNKGMDLPIESIDLTSKEGEIFQTDIYQPVNPESCKGTILFVHGMNKHGNKDPRMMALCRAAALCNYRAIAPTYNLIAKHITDLKSIDDFIDTIEQITTNKTLCPNGKLAIFTASLSGSFSIRSATRPGVAPLITSLCSVGICYHPKTTYTNILKAKNNDLYAKYIAIKSVLRMAGRLDPVLEKGLDFAIDDAFEEDGAGRVHDYIATLSDEHKQELVEIVSGVESYDDLSGKYVEEIEIVHELMKDLARVENLQCPIALIHSEEDMVLPKCETELLYKELVAHHKPAKMLITPILEHADFQFKPKYLVDIIKFVNAFDYFFKYV